MEPLWPDDPAGKGRGGVTIAEPDYDRGVTLYFMFLGVLLEGAVLLLKISSLTHVSLDSFLSSDFFQKIPVFVS